MALFASGRQSGLVIDSGLKATRCVPIVDGVIIAEAYEETQQAGRMLTEKAMSLLREEGIEALL